MASIDTTDCAVVLHLRPFGETSQIASLFTEAVGRIDVTVRASRSVKQKQFAKPAPFIEFEVAWQGKGRLPYLSFCEARRRNNLLGRSMYCGLYLNELLYHLLPKQLPEPELYRAYWQTLELLANENMFEPVLRQFEWRLLALLGYEPNLFTAADGSALNVNKPYVYQAGIGLVPGDRGVVVALGADFLAMAQGQFSQHDQINWALAKRLMRYLISVMLDGRPLLSRQLFS